VHPPASSHCARTLLHQQLFEPRPREDWRRMIAASKEWPRIVPTVLARLQARAEAAAGEPEVNLLVSAHPCMLSFASSNADGEHSPACMPATPRLQKLKRQLKETTEEVARFGSVLAEFLATPSDDWEVRLQTRRGCHLFCPVSLGADAISRHCRMCALITQAMAGLRRPLLSDAFFEYLQVKISSMDPETQGQEQEGTAYGSTRVEHCGTGTARALCAGTAHKPLACSIHRPRHRRGQTADLGPDA
jgi:hypothetical protein